MKFNIKIKGLAPLLFNRFPDEDNADGKSGSKKRKPTKDEQVQASMYFDENGKVYQPAEHFVGAMVKASTSFKLEGKKTYKDLVKGSLFIEPMKIVHKKQKYVADWRSVVIPSTRGRVMKGRGRMDDWELEFQMICIDPRANKQDIVEMLTYAGNYIGVGDYRPRYGRFTVVRCEEVKE